jgi:hypothetical protein
VNIRYIKNSIAGSIANPSSHWVQIAAWKIGRSNNSISDVNSNVAFGKSIVTATSAATSGHDYSLITNGNTATTNYAEASGTGLQSIVIDLGGLVDIESIQVWHYYADGRIYLQNSVLVDTVNTSWAVASTRILQFPTGNNVENVDGILYLVDNTPYNSTAIRSQHRTILAGGLTGVQKRRGATVSTVSSAEKVGQAQFQTFYDGLTKFNTSWANKAVASSPVKEVTRSEIGANLLSTQNNAACGSGCSYLCTDNCQTACYGACGKGCGGTCQSGCGNNCTAGCGTNCAGNCGGNCAGDCAGGCSTYCTNSCTGTCATTCSGTCAKSCSGTNGG